jgi:amidohydrolase
MTLLAKIKSLSESLHGDVVEWRRYLHTNPELSYEEHNTSKYVSTQLKNFGIDLQTSMASTGLVAIIEGKNPTSGAIALRADMDALPIQEANDVEYKSTRAGVMHACGHDVHTASLLRYS